MGTLKRDFVHVRAQIDVRASVCASVCMRVHCVCVCVHICGGQRTTSDVIVQVLHISYFETVSQWPGAHQVSCLRSELQVSLSLPPSTEIPRMHLHA